MGFESILGEYPAFDKGTTINVFTRETSRERPSKLEFVGLKAGRGDYASGGNVSRLRAIVRPRREAKWIEGWGLVISLCSTLNHLRTTPHRY